ncbi:MAG TPA: GNAT family N-acetyltransferase [Stellaceae bacterium]|nr:GNAT family N-acetyltransferase [Stellaceae bacterium]
MFPDIARDDVFRLETRRLWLRWPRAGDAPAIQRYSSKWEVARYTARIPHPYPAGEAERYILAARQANAAGQDLILAIASNRGKREPFGMISLESRLEGRLTLGYALAPEAWGKGYATEAARAIIDASFLLTHAVEILATARIENLASRRVLEKCGFVHQGVGREGAPARGGLVDIDRFRLERSAWAVDYGQRTAAVPPIDAA